MGEVHRALNPDVPLAERVIARERETLAAMMLRLKLLGAPTEAYVWASLSAQIAGYLGAAMSAATPGSVFTPEVMTEWMVGLLHDYERRRSGASDHA